MEPYHFTATKLANSQKKGKLAPDENGYYTLVVGALNVLNSAGQFYEYEAAKELFAANSVFMYRVKNGQVAAELGHPKKLPGMSDDDYVDRIHHIEETNICAYFMDIWLDPNYYKSNPEAQQGSIAILAKVKPAGPMGKYLKEELDDPNQNVCFSIRSLTRNYMVRGKWHKVLKVVVTFDKVSSPGIHVATKWDSPALEDLSSSIISGVSLERFVHRASEIGLESNALVGEIRTLLAPVDYTQKPVYCRW